MQGFTPLPSLIGGAMIGLAASIMLLMNGRIAGISGIVSGTVMPGTKDRDERLAFLVGLLGGGALLFWLRPQSMPNATSLPIGLAAIAGLIVGFGTRLGNGCTSGHGVCGISRLSARSLVATITFMVTGAITVFITQHLL